MDVQILVEKGGERKYVVPEELAKHLQDGWIELGRLYPAKGATVPQPLAPTGTPAPQGKGKGKGKDEGEAVG